MMNKQEADTNENIDVHHQQEAVLNQHEAPTNENVVNHQQEAVLNRQEPATNENVDVHHQQEAVNDQEAAPAPNNQNGDHPGPPPPLNYLYGLPVELRRTILSTLDLKSMMCAEASCTGLKQIIDQPDFLDEMFQLHFGHVAIIPPRQDGESHIRFRKRFKTIASVRLFFAAAANDDDDDDDDDDDVDDD